MEKPEFHYEDHPDHPGWKRWGLKNSDRYNTFLGDMMVCVEDGTCRVRMLPERRHSNLGNNVHGGAMLGFIDVALFAAVDVVAEVGVTPLGQRADAAGAVLDADHHVAEEGVVAIRVLEAPALPAGIVRVVLVEESGL